MDKSLTKASKFMSLVLRHRPEAIGITLDDQGWTDVQELIERSDGTLTEALVKDAVAQNDKQRFALSEDGTQIRANQGHSKKVKVDLALTATAPPELLFHGTAVQSLESIAKTGLSARSRQHVHLSKTYETAVSVGQRHGTPVVLKIKALQMHQDGHSFFISDNQVWLTAEVPVAYIDFDPELEAQMKIAMELMIEDAEALKLLK